MVGLDNVHIEIIRILMGPWKGINPFRKNVLLYLQLGATDYVYPASRLPFRTLGEFTIPPSPPRKSECLMLSNGLLWLLTLSIPSRRLRLPGVPVMSVGSAVGSGPARGSVQNMARNLSTTSRRLSGREFIGSVAIYLRWAEC
jgi:hypothetical protein